MFAGCTFQRDTVKNGIKHQLASLGQLVNLVKSVKLTPKDSMAAQVKLPEEITLQKSSLLDIK